MDTSMTYPALKAKNREARIKTHNVMLKQKGTQTQDTQGGRYLEKKRRASLNKAVHQGHGMQKLQSTNQE